MSINGFDKTNLKSIRGDINAALAEVEAKYGIKLGIGNIRYTNGEFTTKLAARTMNAVAATQNVVKFSPVKIGTRFHCEGRVFTLVDYKPSRPKYPYVGQGPQGGRYKFTAEQVRNGAISA